MRAGGRGRPGTCSPGGWGCRRAPGHALVGGLVGAALVEGGLDAVNWGGMDGLHPVGVFGTLIALAISPVLGGARRACW